MRVSNNRPRYLFRSLHTSSFFHHHHYLPTYHPAHHITRQTTRKMTAPIFRRSLLSLPTRTVAANVSARSSGLRNTGKRALGTSSLTLSTLRPAYSIATRTERKSFLTPTQIRYKSDNGPDSPRKWGFEDVRPQPRNHHP